MAIVHKIIPHYTYDDWVHWEGVWELIDGYPIAMTPTPVPEHQKVSAILITELTNALRKSGCKNCSVYDPLDYKIADDTIVVPDILIVCGSIKNKYLDFPPSLVVEILSPATALKDRHTKFELYQQQGVKYYLIADTDNKTIEAFSLIDHAYQLMSANSYTFELEEGCSITPDFTTVFD